MNEIKLILDAAILAQDYDLRDEMLVIALKFYFYGAIQASGAFNAATETQIAEKVQGLTAQVIRRLEG